jgi:epsilon-lactone hydrolase
MLQSAVLALGLAGAAALFADAGIKRPTFDADGSVYVPPFTLPPSEFISEEARQMMRMRHKVPTSATDQEPDINTRRQQLEAMLAPRVALMLETYPVNVSDQKIAGIPVKVFTPRDKAFDQDRVLVNLHGGAFSVCWPACAFIESAPIASLGGYKVVSVDYRMAPESRHPAGVEDVARVYGELLKSHKPKHIGIYGCSAGGSLSGQAAAWLPAHDLPQAGAIGIFGSGAVRFGAGDSAYLAGYIDGAFPPPVAEGPQPDMTRGYFDGADIEGPIPSPALHPEVMAKFPPTMIITGTRAMDLTPAVYTNSQLINAGVDTRLIVAEGMSHCYIYMPQLPESQDAYRAIVGFFRQNLR